MTQTRRTFLVSAAAGAGVVTLLPYGALADAHASNMFEMPTGETLTVHPVNHASVVLDTPIGAIYVDPVGEAAQYADFPPAELILITHEHGDHYAPDLIAELMGEGTKLITNEAVHDMLPDALKERAVGLVNGGSESFEAMSVEAVPAYNTTEDRKQFHPEGRDNGYVLSYGADFRIYISGDTEDTPEMRALQDIDLAFVCMNLPFTMDATAAASAVSEFQPTYVYPYHYRGRDGGTQDPEAFARMVTGDTEVRFGDWYGGELDKS